MHWVFFKPTSSVVVDDAAQVHSIISVNIVCMPTHQLGTVPGHDAACRMLTKAVVAQTSFAPVLPEDAGASAAYMRDNSSQTMGATRNMVEQVGPSRLQVQQ